jgi:hypothetical protein
LAIQVESALVEQRSAVDTFSFEDYQGDSFGGRYVFQWIAVDDQQVRVVAGLDGSDSFFGTKQVGGVGSGSL